ncbi:hypothetical protein BSK59_13165 [Paenibacillus odorifer]|uniref:hypothetical protein n=1 Tax=Paenibacillus odorifer TaxID=189426 RepID=UPI00096F61D8|nr:hypothetical protein [Paenibacillus odorifer]OME55422.1 hypothetical protein BSK59_13165 [Paenibacillus odorifer]
MNIHQQLFNENRVNQFASKYLEMGEDQEGNSYRINDWNNLTDENFERAFNNCVAPLKPELYNDLRAKLKVIIAERCDKR